MQAPLKVVCIIGCGHSGSTLLDLLISSHSQVMSVGEVTRMHKVGSLPQSCSCDAPCVWECPFWSRVNAVMAQATGLTLRDLHLDTKAKAKCLAHNLALFQAVSQASGKRVIVDSSKGPGRFRRLYNARAFEVLPILIIRRPQGVVYSNVKKGGNWWEWTRNYVDFMKNARRLLRGVPHNVVRYEKLVADPAGVLTPIMAKLGLEFEPGQLQWAARERHNCGGNEMRHATDSTIRLDTAWRHGLGWWQKTVIGLMTWRAA